VDHPPVGTSIARRDGIPLGASGRTYSASQSTGRLTRGRIGSVSPGEISWLESDADVRFALLAERNRSSRFAREKTSGAPLAAEI